MSIAVVKAFRPTVQACWITTYNLDLGLFDGFLLSKLGEPPLNVVVLADGVRHDRALESLPADEAWRIDRINRRWLLKPIDHTAAFHPKTLLFVEPSTTTLLVGSGNLSDSGLDSGNELFTTFTTADAEGLAAVAGWVHWMRDIVDRTGDELLGWRFSDLLRRLPGLPPPGGGFVHNLVEPLLAQMLRVTDAPVDELLLTAPFFDEHLEAAMRIIDRTAPRRIAVYLGERTSVDGTALRRLAAQVNGALELYRYTPGPFVHAKLVGCIDRNRRGVLLSGSANLSLAALLGSVRGDPWANYEAGVLAELGAEALRAAFANPPRLDVLPVDLDVFADHSIQRDLESPRPPLRIRSATRTTDGAIALEIVGTPPDGAEVTDGAQAVRLAEVVTLPGRLIWIAHDGDPISNRAIVSEIGELEAQLRQRHPSDRGRPAELHSGDTETPLGAILVAMHQSFIMDVADTDAVGAAERAADYEGEGDADTDLWERLANDTLNYDPRASSYARASIGAGADSPILELLAMMLSRTPSEVHDLYRNVVTFPLPPDEGAGTQTAEGERPPQRWAESTRIRVRARNVLRRWADAIGDRRLLWIDPSAPLTNYSTMIDAICVLRSINHTEAASGLTDEDLDDLTDRTMQAVLAALAGTAPAAPVSEHTVASATTILTLALSPGRDRRARLLHWQPRLRPLLDLGLVQPTSLAAYYLTTLFNRPTDAQAIARLINDAISFIDDSEWARRLELELGLHGVSYGDLHADQQLDALVHAGGIDNPLTDPRTLRLLDAIRDYRDARRIAIYDIQDRWRLVVVPAEAALLRADWLEDGVVESTGPIDPGELDRLLAAGSSLAELFLPEHRAA